MPFCPKCGASVEGRFCAACGTSMNAQGGYAAPPAGAPPPPPGAAASGLQDNVAAALCYSLWFITGILFLVLEPYNRNRTIRFHAFQSIFLSGVLFLLHWVIFFVAMASYGIGFILSPLLWLLSLGLWLFMMYKAYNNEMVSLPV